MNKQQLIELMQTQRGAVELVYMCTVRSMSIDEYIKEYSDSDGNLDEFEQTNVPLARVLMLLYDWDGIGIYSEYDEMNDEILTQQYEHIMKMHNNQYTIIGISCEYYSFHGWIGVKLR